MGVLLDILSIGDFTMCIALKQSAKVYIGGSAAIVIAGVGSAF